jgi:heat shock protein HslJ
MDRTDRRYTAVITPHCATINAPVNVTSDEIVVNMNRAGIAAVACNEPTAEMDAFFTSLIAQPLTYTWNDETLTLMNETGSLTFAPAAHKSPNDKLLIDASADHFGCFR